MTRTRITTDGITDSSVTTAKVADAAITDAKISAVAAAKITGQIATSQVADGAITTAKIANDAVVTQGILNSNVTYPKIQNVSATDRLLGRSSAGAGVIEEIACTAAGRALIDDADADAQRTTLGLGTMATATAADYLARAGGTMTGAVQVTAGTAAAPGVAISGDTDTGITQAGGANTLSVATNGVERWRVGADGAAQSVIPGGSTLYPQFMCRAWVNFDGTRDSTGALSTANTNRLIRGSGNVLSVMRNAAGDYTITFTTAMPDANYSYSHSYSNEVNMQHTIGFLGSMSASSLSVRHYNAANSANTSDKSSVLIAIFR